MVENDALYVNSKQKISFLTFLFAKQPITASYVHTNLLILCVNGSPPNP